MIIVIHGQNEVASRSYLSSLIEAGFSAGVMRMDKSEITAEKVSQIAGGSSLFGEVRKVVIENYLKQRTPGKKGPTDKALESFPGDLILWEDGQRSAGALSVFPTAKVFEFKVSSTVFKFLDSLRPGNPGGNILSFHQALGGSSPEVILPMLGRRMVDLLAPPSKVAGWQRERLKVQSRLFSEEVIVSAIRRLVEIDIGQKTSSSPLFLKGQIERFLLGL